MYIQGELQHEREVRLIGLIVNCSQLNSSDRYTLSLPFFLRFYPFIFMN